MKRKKSSDIIAEICTEANIRQSITAVLRGSHRKKTKEGRYLVQAQVLKISPKQRAERSVNKGEVAKFFTGVEDNYDICDGLKEADQLGNNAVTVEEEKSGGFPMYIFV